MVKRATQALPDEEQRGSPARDNSVAKQAVVHYKQIQSLRKVEPCVSTAKIRKQRVTKRTREEREPKADKKLVFMSKSVYQKLLDNKRISTTRLTNEIFEEFKRFIKVS
jgi:hypothetical protein